MLEAAWLVADRAPRTSWRFERWRLRDPVTGVEHDAPGMGDGDGVIARLQDGRLIVRFALDRGTVGLAFVDLRDGSRRALRVDGRDEQRIRSVHTVFRGTSLALGRDWFEIHSNLVSLGAGEGALRLDAINAHFVGPLDSEHLLVTARDGREVLRLHAASGATTLIYPR